MLPEYLIFGLTISAYNFWNSISAIVMVCYVLFQFKKYYEICPTALKQKNERKKLVVVWGEYILIIAVTALLLTFLNKRFGDWFTHGNANYFGSLTGWLVSVTVLTAFFRVSPLQVHDFFAPALPLQLFFAKLACFFHGCCSGFEMLDSFYHNTYTDKYEFPAQLVEALVALALFFFLRSYQKRNKLSGSVFPVYLIVYSITRFFTEFLRADFPNVLGPLDAYQVMSISFAIIGGFLLYIVWIYKDERAQRDKKRNSF